ncbi:MAG: hypothetical protein H0W65_00615 [Sphingomonas sp.]|uniref:B3/B4 domain-containing protein n=1 Tax=Sphingomonas sp. TaxID=28214 RepID=UPI0017FCB35F|nr:phenylalanine--tRNA ligase beta subunit-related protein [Sphingomonas sp.]MBA3666213.1 hypothetical protein [Sphingomonas sp.]
MGLIGARIGDDVRQLRPDFRAISIVATGVENRIDHPIARALLAEARKSLDFAPWADAHLEAWRETFRAFGAKPKKTASSVEALRSRVAKSGELPPINAVVDLYNAVSIKFALPVGGENLDSYVGRPRLIRADGSETFDTVRDGRLIHEPVDRGEVIWRDDLGTTCRRWNWRQCLRTRIEPSSTRLWFVLEALAPMADEAVEDAARSLCGALAVISPSASIDRQWLR